MKLQHLKIGTRLGASFALMLALMAGITAIALFASSQTRDSLHQTIERNKTAKGRRRDPAP
jgi:CHASE3 domain sensor protein